MHTPHHQHTSKKIIIRLKERTRGRVGGEEAKAFLLFFSLSSFSSYTSPDIPL